MPCYIKGEGGVQTPWLPDVGLKEERGGGRRTLQVQLGLGAQAPLPCLVRLPLLGPLRAHVGGSPLFPLFN